MTACPSELLATHVARHCSTAQIGTAPVLAARTKVCRAPLGSLQTRSPRRQHALEALDASSPGVGCRVSGHQRDHCHACHAPRLENSDHLSRNESASRLSYARARAKRQKLEKGEKEPSGNLFDARAYDIGDKIFRLKRINALRARNRPKTPFFSQEGRDKRDRTPLIGVWQGCRKAICHRCHAPPLPDCAAFIPPQLACS